MKYLFIKSSTDHKMCPEPSIPEVALIGRSNVGKSSLINTLLEAKSAAKVSSTPGKTQVINHFLIQDRWYMVDLPGYGYAKVSQTERAKWDKMVKNYLTQRKNLALLFVLIDSRIPPQKSDLEFIRFVGKNGIPFALVFTKADKQSPGKTKASVEAFTSELKKDWDEMPPMVVSSSISGMGREEIFDLIVESLENYQSGQDVSEA